MTDVTNPTANEASSDNVDIKAIQEQLNALTAENERMRKHNETLLSEKKAEQAKQREAQAEKDKLAEEQARKKGDLEAIEKQYQDKIARLEADIAERDKQRDFDLVQSTALKLATSLSDNPNNQEVLQMLIEKRLVAENGQVKVTDSNGNPSIASLDEFKRELTTSGKYDSLITGTKASGTGASGNSGATTKQAHEYTEAERLEMAVKNPEQFNQLFMT